MFSDIYVEMYDSLNNKKNYQEESDFILKIYSQVTDSFFPESVLDLGCGTGIHLENISKIIGQKTKLVGVDVNKYFCDKAKQNIGSIAEIDQDDILEYDKKEKFDLVMSLFHVVNYQSETKNLVQFMKTISRHLSPKGVAVIDFWNKSAWHYDPPSTRLSKFVMDGYSYERTSTPEINLLEGSMKLRIELRKFKENNERSVPIKIENEIHNLRAFTPFELELAAFQSDLKIAKLGKWMDSNNSLKAKDWYGFIVLIPSKQRVK